MQEEFRQITSYLLEGLRQITSSKNFSEIVIWTIEFFFRTIQISCFLPQLKFGVPQCFPGPFGLIIRLKEIFADS